MTNLLDLVRGFKADLDRAQGLLDHAKLDELAEVLEKYDGLFATDVNLALLRARLAFGRYDFAKASQLFTKVLALDPYHSRATAIQSQCLAKLDRRGEAMQLLEKLREAKPDDNMALEYYLPLVVSERGLAAAVAVLSAEHRRRGGRNLPTQAAEILRQKAISLFDVAEIRAADPDDLLGIDASVDQGYSLRTIYPLFEPLGCNCEFGFVQRKHGVEPLSLFRWTTVNPPDLIRLLESDLEGYERPEIYTIENVSGREYLLKENTFGTISHTGVDTADLSPEEFLHRVTRRQGFLKRKFLGDAAEGKKIFIYKSNRMLDTQEINVIDSHLVRLGVRYRLFVMFDADKAKGGTVEIPAEGRMIGYTSSVMPETPYPEWDRIVVAAFDHFIGRA